jgi:MoxR-like ATPase
MQRSSRRFSIIARRQYHINRVSRPSTIRLSMTTNNGKAGSSLSRLAAIGKQMIPSIPFTTKASNDQPGYLEQQEQLGTLRFGPSVELPVYAPNDPTRLPDERLLLSLEDPITLESLEWMAKKYALGQDMFLLSQPGPYARRLALTFAALLQLPVEHVALHRDVGEAELLQTRNLEKGGNLSYTDGPVVRAMKMGGILILEGVERAERNVLPLLNNILENREQDLPDGTSLVPASRLQLARKEEAIRTGSKISKISRFQAVNPHFRVIALGLPTPPYKGNPLDPPFRSRYQARWVEGVVPSSLQDAPVLDEALQQKTSLLKERIFEWAALLRYHATAARGADVLPPASQLPNVPASSLSLLDDLVSRFPPKEDLAPPPKITLSEEEKKLGETPARVRDGALSVPERTRDMVQAREAANLKKIDESGSRMAKDTKVAPSTNTVIGAGYPMMHTLDAAKKRLAVELLWSIGLDKGMGTGQDWEDTGAGMMGYRVAGIERVDPSHARVSFDQIHGGAQQSVTVACGPLEFAPLPMIDDQAQGNNDILVTPRLYSILSSMLQLHALGRDICLLPSAFASSSEDASANVMQASSSTSTSISLFASLLGYPVESLWLHKDTSGTELIMRRGTTADGSTTWEPAPLLRGATEARIVHLAGIDVLGPTLASLARLTQDRELELWSGGRAALAGSKMPEIEGKQVGRGRLTTIDPTFRIIATAAAARSDWLNEESSTLFGFVQPSPMTSAEERQVIQVRTGCPPEHLDTLLNFSNKYRSLSNQSGLGLAKSRRLGTRALIRMASRLARFPTNTDMYALVSRNLLMDFLPRTTKELVARVLDESGLHPRGAEGAFQFRPQEWLADPEVGNGTLTFKDSNSLDLEPVVVPLYNVDKADPEGKHLIPTLGSSFYNNNTQSLLLRDLAIDLQVMGEHLLLMGNQGTGKNKVIDRIVELLQRPREYMQLHRDSTVAQILQLVELKAGQIKFLESPLVRAIRLGRVAVIDEADKCSAAVTAVFKSLAERGELSLPDGRRVRPANTAGSSDDVIVHPDFRLVLLANRPGFPFLGNAFLEVLGEGFSCYAVGNPDLASEVRLLQQAAPSVDEKLIRNLDLAFHDLRDAFDAGLVTYPYSLRELLHIVRHLHRFPEESLTNVLLNTLSFDLHRPEAIQLVYDTLRKRGLDVEGLSLAAIRERAEETKKNGPGKIEWDPKKLGKDTSLSGPKEGKTDPKNEEHSGGNKWRGGTGGRDTAGLGGRGGFERVNSGHEIKQISNELKKDVPEHIKEQARVMAQKALAERLANEGYVHSIQSSKGMLTSALNVLA